MRFILLSRFPCSDAFEHAEIDGALYRIRVAHRRLIAPAEFSFVRGELRLN